MKDYSSSIVPIQKGDKFRLMQCPQNDLKQKQMKTTLTPQLWVA